MFKERNIYRPNNKIILKTRCSAQDHQHQQKKAEEHENIHLINKLAIAGAKMTGKNWRNSTFSQTNIH